jgi:hypothetical protein
LPCISAQTYKCSTCDKEGYGIFLQNDPIYSSMELWAKSAAPTTSTTVDKSDACLDCADDVCAILPPAGSAFPCYQGSDSNANKCFNTDPLIADGSSYVCGTCASVGYPTYLQNDPIYTNMELWSPSSKLQKNEKGACDACADDLCSIVPPVGSSFPCYEGSVDNTNTCFATDPLLQANSTTLCASCASSGYGSYLMNDPIYKSMALWSV